MRGNRFRNAFGYAARNALFFIAVYEILSFLFHDGLFFLGHGSPHKVAPPHSISCEVANYLHHLLLINYTAVGGREYMLKLRTVIAYRSRVIFTLYISGNKIHRSRTVQRYSGYHILKAGRLKLLHEILHAGTFKLKNSFAFSAAYHIEDRPVVVVYFIYIKRSPAPLVDIFLGVLYDGKRAQSEKIHFKKPQLLNGSHGKLRCKRAVRRP